MKKEDINYIFRKHHLRFSLKLILFVTLVVGVGMHYDADHSLITLSVIGVLVPLLLNLFKDVITELYTTENVDGS